MRKQTRIFLIILLLCIFSYSLYRVYNILEVRKEAGESYEDLNQFVQVKDLSLENDDQEPIVEENVNVEEVNKEPLLIQRYIEVDFESLKAENPDFYGWLYLINDTNINYPVVQGEDNAFYLNHLFDGKVNANGTLFLDYRNTQVPLSDNSIVYGHRMKSGAMFYNLGNFKKQKFYEEHPYFYLELPDRELKLEVFASYVTPAVSDAYVISFNEEDGYIIDENGNRKVSYRFSETIPTFEKWYEDVMNKNLLLTDVNVKKGDKIFTFSTCDYSYSNARFVVHCKVAETD